MLQSLLLPLLSLNADTCEQAARLRAILYPTPDSARLEWSPGAGGTSYQIRLRAVGAPTWRMHSTTDTALVETGLQPGTRYEFQVNTVCPAYISGYTASKVFTTIVTAARRRQEMPILSVQVLDMGGRPVASAGPCSQLDEVRPPMPGTYMYLVETAIGQYALRKVVQ